MIAVFAFLFAGLVTASAQACEFEAVKEQIDIVLDRDAGRGAEFRKQVKDGAESIAVMEALVSPDVRVKMDVCRYHVSEYLTKRGYPPPH